MAPAFGVQTRAAMVARMMAELNVRVTAIVPTAVTASKVRHRPPHRIEDAPRAGKRTEPTRGTPLGTRTDPVQRATRTHSRARANDSGRAASQLPVPVDLATPRRPTGKPFRNPLRKTGQVFCGIVGSRTESLGHASERLLLDDHCGSPHHGTTATPRPVLLRLSEPRRRQRRGATVRLDTRHFSQEPISDVDPRRH